MEYTAITTTDRRESTSTKVWLHLLKEGQCMTADIAKDLGIDFAMVSRALVTMIASGNVRRYSEVGARRMTVGVTFTCLIPRNVSVIDILEIVKPSNDQKMIYAPSIENS